MLKPTLHIDTVVQATRIVEEYVDGGFMMTFVEPSHVFFGELFCTICAWNAIRAGPVEYQVKVSCVS